MNKGLIVSLLMLPGLALANQTLISEIEAGDVWLGVDYASITSEVTGTYEGVSKTETTDQDIKSFGITSTFDSGAGAVPLVAINFNNVKQDDISINTYGLGLGAKLELDSKRSLVLAASYETSNDDAARSVFAYGIDFGKQASEFYNQFSLAAAFPENTSTVEGGNIIIIVNTVKITPAHNIVLSGNFGVKLTSDIVLDDDMTISSGPLFTFGGGAELFFNKKLSAAVSLEKGFGDAEAKYYDETIDMDLDTTKIEIALNARF